MIQEQIKHIDLLEQQHILPEQELIALLNGQSQELCDYLFQKADAVRRANYGTDVYVRAFAPLYFREEKTLFIHQNV